jgi:hypothetical protein
MGKAFPFYRLMVASIVGLSAFILCRILFFIITAPHSMVIGWILTFRQLLVSIIIGILAGGITFRFLSQPRKSTAIWLLLALAILIVLHRATFVFPQVIPTSWLNLWVN